MHLTQREVLERSRVEHHLGPVCREHLGHAGAVADVGDHEVRAVEQGPTVDRELHSVKGALVAIEHHERRGLEAVHLAAQL